MLLELDELSDALETTSEPKSTFENPAYSKEEMEKQARLSGVLGHVLDCYEKAKTDREVTEAVWVRALRSWRGEYSPEEKMFLAKMKERDPSASEIFIKVTKTKIEAAHAQILDILFSSERFPIGIKPTTVPEGIADKIYIDPKPSEQGEVEESEETLDVYGYAGDGAQIPKGATIETLGGGLRGTLKKLADKVKIGASPNKQEMPQFNPAKEAAYKTDKVIQDQLAEGMVQDELTTMVLEQAILGTGVLKGPISYYDKVDHWDKDKVTGKVYYNPKDKLTPKTKFVSVWNFFPDPSATTIQDCSYVIERHLMNRKQLTDLMRQPFFDRMAIERLLDEEEGYLEEDYEYDKKDNITETPDRYEIFEYWGYLTKDLADALDLEYDYEMETVQVCVWCSKGEVLKAVLNPFVPSRIPYHVVPYEKHLYQIWGIGIAENMADTQAIMNGTMRAAADNLKISGSMVFEVNRSKLEPGQDMVIHPNKIFYTRNAAPGQTIFGQQFPNTTPANIQMFDKARQLADEATGLYSYAHGGTTGYASSTRTGSVMSMLMGAAAINIKKVVRNIDQHILEPLGYAYFAWNMQFNQENVDIEGDMQIVAKGTTALLQKEVKTQRLLSLMQVGANPSAAPFMNWVFIIKEIARSLDLDVDEVVNDPQQALLYMMAMNQNAGNGNNPQEGGISPQQQQLGAAQGNTGGVNPADPTGSGGGNIGVGSIPQPGQAGFSANTS